MISATFRSSLVRIAAGLLSCSAVLSAQVSPECERARHDEEERHRDAQAEISKRQVDNSNEYNKKLIGCRNSDSCRKDAREERDVKQIKISQDASDENATYSKNLIDIGRGRCNTRPSAGPTSASAPADKESPILASGDQQRLFKLGAEMNTIADEVAQDAQGNSGAEFLKGLADWADGTLKMLAQKPGVPVQQQAQAIIDYLTNDNAANHRVLLQAAQQAEREFEKNPARFVGQNLPNALPTPGLGTLAKIPALRQLAAVENAANRIKSIASSRRAFSRTITNTLAENKQWGRTVGVNECFADNACFPTARAEAEMFRTDGPLNNGTPVTIRVHALETRNMVKTSAQITKNLSPVGANFTPRNPGTFTADQLAQIAQGNPISVKSPAHIAQLLESEGVGSQGLVFVGYSPTSAHVAGSPLGHVMNVEKPTRAPAQFIDKTTPGKAPVLDRNRVSELWFFPMH